MPVLEHVVQHLQVVERRTGRGQDVAAVVAPPVLLQVVALAGRGNELPHAGGLRGRNCARVIGRFDQRQQGQLGGHAALFDFLDNMKEEWAGAFEAAPQVFGACRVPAGFVLGGRIGELWHREAVAHALPQVGHRLVGHVHIANGQLQNFLRRRWRTCLQGRRRRRGEWLVDFGDTHNGSAAAGCQQ